MFDLREWNMRNGLTICSILVVLCALTACLAEATIKNATPIAVPNEDTATPQQAIPSPSATIVPAPSTHTSEPIPPTSTATSVPPTATATRISATATLRSIPPTATAVKVPTMPTVVTAQSCSESACTDQTIVFVKLPFEPSWPGYTFRVRSKNFSASLACFYNNQNEKKGHVASLDDNTKIPDDWPCDGRSFTFNRAIDGDLTLFFVLGGFPLIPDVTKSPSRVTEIKSNNPNCKSVCRRIEFEFDYKESLP